MLVALVLLLGLVALSGLLGSSEGPGSAAVEAVLDGAQVHLLRCWPRLGPGPYPRWLLHVRADAFIIESCSARMNAML